jgi:hypothetical protein
LEQGPAGLTGFEGRGEAAIGNAESDTTERLVTGSNGPQVKLDSDEAGRRENLIGVDHAGDGPDAEDQ